MPAEPILTICIPTYNRANILVEILTFIKDITQDQPDIEILVSDNASTDNTQSVLEEISKDWGNIRHIRQDSNVGFDLNVNAVVCNALGKWCWILSDDDSFDSILPSVLLDTIKKHESAAHIFIDYNLKSEADGKISPSTANLGNTVEEVFGPKSYCKKTDLAVSFVSSVVVKKELWIDIKADRYAGTNFIHMYAIHDILRNHSAILLGGQLLTMTCVPLESSRGYHSIEFYFRATFSIAQFGLSLPENEQKDGTQEIYMSISGKDNTWQIVSSRRVNTPPLKDRYNLLKKMSKLFGKTPRFWLLDIPLLFMPTILFKIMDSSQIALKKAIKKSKH